MKLDKAPLPEPVLGMRHAISAQRMSLSIRQRSTAGLNAVASCTANPATPAVVMLEAREAAFELEWQLHPEQARALASKLLEAAANCDGLDSFSCVVYGDERTGVEPA